MRKLAVVVIFVVLAFSLYKVTRQRAQHPGWISVSVSSKLSGVEMPPAPQVLLTDLNGKAINTASFRGKVLLVNFWAAWCTPCAEEVPQFIALERKYQDQGLQIVGISIDDSDSQLRDFYERYRMNYPVIAGNQRVAEAYGGILGLPTTLVINREGLIEKKFTGATDFAILEKEISGLLQTVQR